MNGRKLVLVSNRGPIEFDLDDSGRRISRRGAGGLITALDSALESADALWVAAAMTDEDRVVAREGQLIAVPEDSPRYHVSLVDIDPPTYDQYYNEISNKVLWFLQHYLFDTVYSPSFGPDDYASWNNGYVEANRLFAQTICGSALKGVDRPVVMIQDYHLYLTGGFIRQARPDAIIFHFIHIPWPSADYLRLLPVNMRKQILASLTSCDLIGFHSWRYARNFMQCCADFLGCRIDQDRHIVEIGDRQIKVKAYPISVSPRGLESIAGQVEVKKEIEKIATMRRGRRLIVRIDRAELSKNLIRGFAAYEQLLREHPELHEEVVFLAHAYPTRQRLTEYREYQEAVERKAADINEVFGTPDWKPIEMHIEDNFPRSVAAMTQFDVLLTNPVFDGMNLVAKEAAVLNKTDGVIVLSENAGAFEELRDGVLGINPFDIADTSKKLYQALTMKPIEKSSRAARLREIVLRNDSTKWLAHQLEDIDKLTKPASD